MSTHPIKKPTEIPDFFYLASQLAKDQYQADLVLYCGNIDHKGAGVAHVSRALQMDSRAKNLVFILDTPGGSPDDAYKIVRQLKRAYKDGEIYFYIARRCKSAGTLMTLCANKIIMSPCAELGPLDMQVNEKDELFGKGSGLNTIQAVSYLHDLARENFTNHMIDIRLNGGVSTRMASEIASNMAVGLFSKMFEQIDPIRVAEMSRAISVATAYGERIASENVNSGTIKKLVHEYPCHSFVIDSDEAKTLFKNVICPEPKLDDAISKLLSTVDAIRVNNPIVVMNLTKIAEDAKKSSLSADHPHKPEVPNHAAANNGTDRTDSGVPGDKTPSAAPTEGTGRKNPIPADQGGKSKGKHPSTGASSPSRRDDSKMKNVSP